jgi:hypothetical protein
MYLTLVIKTAGYIDKSKNNDQDVFPSEFYLEKRGKEEE